MVIKAVKGVKDILPDSIGLWRHVEGKAREVFARFGFSEIVLPIFEKSEVFIKGVGEDTDIVQKEIYTFTDRGGESLTLRPEGTASCVRAYIEHSMHHPQGTVTKLFYTGPMFRRERPQAGRFRQFFQIGAELFGAEEPEADAEVVQLLDILVRDIGAREPRLYLNSLGCDVCRPVFKKELIAFLAKRKDSLCENCIRRYEGNPLRVLDCKSSGCGEIVENAPSIKDYWCPACSAHFAAVRRRLDELAIGYELNPRMVRGLDYYNRTVFEITAEGLGAQNSIAGGGRYDSLVRQSGGPDVPAIGFAIGMERLLASMDVPVLPDPAAPDVFIVSIGEKAHDESYRICGRLRAMGIKVERAYKPAGMKNQMAKAGKSGARLALIVGEEELGRGVAKVKELTTGKQEEVALENMGESISSMLRAAPPD